MMRAVIYKDLRQQWPWLVGVSLLAIAYGVVSLMRWPATVDWWSALLPFLSGSYYDIDPTPPLVRLEGIYILASAYGVVLGLLQGLSDTRGTSDFFLHRPCSRTRLAIAKLLGGSLLFWVPGMGAVALMTVWAGFGRFASPFRAWMVLVPLLSWWIGYGFYLAATNVAWRQGRWFGPRLLPLVAPIPVAALVLAQASLALVFLALVLLTITYWLVNVHVLACQEHGARTWNRGWDSAARLLTGVTLLVGLLSGIIFVGAIVVNLFPRDWNFRSVVFTEEGEPRIQTREFDDIGRLVYEWFDLSGKSVGRYVDYKDVPSLSMATVTDANSFRPWARRSVTTLSGFGRDARRHQVFWYLMENDGVVVGYAHPTGAVLGSFGPQGRMKNGVGGGFVSVRQVQGTQYQTGTSMGHSFDHLFVDGDSLYAFTLNPPKMAKWYESNAGQIDRVGLRYDWWDRGVTGLVFSESNGQLSALGEDGIEVATVDLPVPLRDRRWYLSAGWTGKRIVLAKWESANRTLAYAISPTGETLNEWVVKLRDPEPFVWWKSTTHLPGNLCAAPWFGVVALTADQYAEPALALKSYWPLLLVSAVITFASVILTRRHLKDRRSRANVIWWLAVVALLSWPGYLLCLITARLPKRIGCPACGDPRPTETATCPHCRADWPLPKHTGLEILLPAHR